MIGCLWTRVRKQPIIALYFESENELKLYNLKARSPADVIGQEMIDCVERLVLTDRRINIAELASECGISNGNVYTIIHGSLGISKVSARWVPRNLNMQDRQKRLATCKELLDV